MNKQEESPFEGFLASVHKGPANNQIQSTHLGLNAPANQKTQVVNEETTKHEELPRRKRKPQPDYQKQFFVRVDFAQRKPLYITASTHRRLMRIVHLMEGSKATISSYVENILLNHLDVYRDEIDAIYQEYSKSPTDME